MNKVILMGRLTRDPDVRYSQGDNSMAIARYTLAVDRRMSRQNNNGGEQQQTADFISCVAFGRSAEFAEKYLHQGTKLVVTGRIQTGSYTNRDGQKVYTTDVVVEDQEIDRCIRSLPSAIAHGGCELEVIFAIFIRDREIHARKFITVCHDFEGLEFHIQYLIIDRWIIDKIR